MKTLFKKAIAKLLGLDAMYQYIADLKKDIVSLNKDLDENFDDRNKIVDTLNENTSDIINILLRLRLNNLLTEEQYRVFYEKKDEED